MGIRIDKWAMNLLGGKARIMHIILRELVDGANDQIDTEQEREKIAGWLNEKIDLPFLNEEEEEKLFENALEKLHVALEELEQIIRK